MQTLALSDSELDQLFNRSQQCTQKTSKNNYILFAHTHEYEAYDDSAGHSVCCGTFSPQQPPACVPRRTPFYQFLSQ